MRVKNENSDVTFMIFHQWIADIYGEKWPQPDAPTHQALSKSATRLTAKLEKLRKMRSSIEKETLLTEFFAEEYTLPRLGYCRGRVISFSPQRPSKKKTASPESHDAVKEMWQKM